MEEDPLREKEVPVEKPKKEKRKEELNRASVGEESEGSKKGKNNGADTNDRIKPFEKKHEGEEDEDSMDQTIDQLMNGDGSLKNMYK